MTDEIKWEDIKIEWCEDYKVNPFGLMCIWDVRDTHLIGTFATVDSEKWSHSKRATKEMAEKHFDEAFDSDPWTMYFEFNGQKMVMGPPNSFRFSPIIDDVIPDGEIKNTRRRNE